MYKLLKYILNEDKLDFEHHACWWPGNARSQGPKVPGHQYDVFFLWLMQKFPSTIHGDRAESEQCLLPQASWYQQACIDDTNTLSMA